jgi:hypothetical protein
MTSKDAPAAPRRLIVWAEPGDEALVRDVVACGHFELVAVGCPERGRAAALASALGAAHEDDARRLIATHAADLAWFACSAGIDAERVAQAQEAGLRPFASEPVPAAIQDARPDDPGVEFLPCLRRSPVMLAARDVLESFGTIRGVAIANRCAAGQGRLLGRLYDSVDLVTSLCGQPESVDAALAAPGDGAEAAPDSLRVMRGHLTANLRFADNRCAGLSLSDDAGAWFRGCTLLGDGGCLRIGDDGFEWIGREGRVLDRHRVDPVPSLASVIAGQMLEPPGPAPAPDRRLLLGVCEAARLSCRTGSAELPRLMVEMAGR